MKTFDPAWFLLYTVTPCRMVMVYTFLFIGLIFTLQGPALALSYRATIHICTRRWTLDKFCRIQFLPCKVLLCPALQSFLQCKMGRPLIPSSQNGTRLYISIYKTGQGGTKCGNRGIRFLDSEGPHR